MTTHMKNQTQAQVDEQMVLLSQYYPGIYDQLIPEQGEVVKPRRRRRKSKADGSGSGMRKRKLSDQQVTMLEENFGNEHKLESERKDRLASELGLDPRQVAVWFQNRRARWKTKKLEEEYNKLKTEHDSTVLDKCRLETENNKLKTEHDSAVLDKCRLETEYNKLKTEHDSTVLDKCRLETEVLKLKEQLSDAENEKEINRLVERSDGISSTSPSSSFSMEAMEPPFLGGFGMEGLENVFYLPENNYIQGGLDWFNI